MWEDEDEEWFPVDDFTDDDEDEYSWHEKGEDGSSPMHDETSEDEVDVTADEMPFWEEQKTLDQQIPILLNGVSDSVAHQMQKVHQALRSRFDARIEWVCERAFARPCLLTRSSDRMSCSNTHGRKRCIVLRAVCFRVNNSIG